VLTCVTCHRPFSRGANEARGGLRGWRLQRQGGWEKRKDKKKNFKRRGGSIRREEGSSPNQLAGSSLQVDPVDRGGQAQGRS